MTLKEGTIYHAPGRGYFYLTHDRRIVWIANGWYFYRRKG